MINQDAFLDTLSTAKPLPQLLSKLPPSLSLNDNITVLISMIPIQASPALHATLHCYPGNTIYQVSTELLPTQVMQKTHVQPLLVYISPDPKSPQAIALLAKSWCHIQVSVQSDSISDSRYPLILRSQLFTINARVYNTGPIIFKIKYISQHFFIEDAFLAFHLSPAPNRLEMLQKAHLSTKQNALSTSFEYSNATAIDSQDPDVSFGDKSMGDRRMTIIGMPTWLVEFNTLRETPIVRNNKRIAAARTIHRWFQNVRTRQNLPKSRSDNLIISDKLGNTKIAGADGGPSTSTMLAPAISLITAALKIQSAWKKFVARSEFLLKIKAVSMIQRWYREMRSDASDKRNTAATKIQHIWRLKLIAIYENRLDLAARIIQRAFRRCKARRRDNSALAIQSWWRKISNYQRCVKVSAAVTIQRCLRGFMVRCKYGLIRHAVIKIQSLWRAKLQSRKYHFALIDIIKCQSIARMQIARKKLRRQLVLIRKVQAQIKMKQQRKAFKTARNGIILLQKLVRRNLVFTARKRESAAKVIQRKWLSHRKNNAAIVIQKHWILVLRERRKSYLISRLVIFQAHCRKFLERKKYQLTRNACITIQRAYRKFLAKSVSILSILTITNKRRATRRPSDINIPACAVENIKSKKRRKSISKENWGTVSPVAIPERLVEHKPKEVLTSSENFPKYSTKSPKPKITSSSLANITANAEKIASIESFYSKSPASRLPAGRKLLLKSKEGLQNTSISNMSAESPVKQSILTLSVRQSHATEIPICPSTFDNHARILDSDISQQQAKRGPLRLRSSRISSADNSVRNEEIQCKKDALREKLDASNGPQRAEEERRKAQAKIAQQTSTFTKRNAGYKYVNVIKQKIQKSGPAPPSPTSVLEARMANRIGKRTYISLEPAIEASKVHWGPALIDLFPDNTNNGYTPRILTAIEPNKSLLKSPKISSLPQDNHSVIVRKFSYESSPVAPQKRKSYIN